MYKIHTKGHVPVANGDYPQFDGYVGNFKNIEEAEKGARFLSNSRQLPLSLYSVVNANDVSEVVVAEIQPGEAAYVYGAQMG